MYYRLDTRVVPRDPELANTTTTRGLSVPWTMGIHYPHHLPDPVVVDLNPKRGRKMRDLFLIDVPLFSDRLLDALYSVGVDNLQTFDAQIRSPEGESFDNYKAVNIVGLVSCTNLEQSVYVPELQPPVMEFGKLVIDEEKAMGKPLFRLAEDSLCILISERVKESIDKGGFVGYGIWPIESA